jgi:hypothetical protein
MSRERIILFFSVSKGHYNKWHSYPSVCVKPSCPGNYGCVFHYAVLPKQNALISLCQPGAAVVIVTKVILWTEFLEVSGSH